MNRSWLAPLVVALTLSLGVACAGPAAPQAQPSGTTSPGATIQASLTRSPTLGSTSLSPSPSPSIVLPTPDGAPTGISSGLAPAMPGDHAGRTQCLVCHSTGADGAPKLPTANPDHSAFTDANNAQTCLGCHSVAK